MPEDMANHEPDQSTAPQASESGAGENGIPPEPAVESEAAPVADELPQESDAVPEEVAAEDPGEPPAPAPEASNKHWDVVKAPGGREESNKEALRRRVRIEALE